MLRYAFRLHRWGMIGFGAVLLLITYAQGAGFVQLAGGTPAARAVFANSMAVLGTQLFYLFPAPFRLDTLAGFVQWRAYGPIEVMVMIWAIAAGTAAVRVDEDRQLVDYWLAARVSRARLVASRLVAFGLAALVAVAAAALGVLAGAAGHATIDPGGLAGKSLALLMLIVVLFALCLLASQFAATQRGAQTGAAALLVALYLCDVVARSNHSLDGLAWISPFRWYDATTSLAPGGHFDVAAILLTAGLIVAAGVLTALAFSRRDVRGALLARPAREAGARDAAPSPLLSWPVGRLLYRQRGVVIGWALASAGFAVFMVGTAHSIVDTLKGVPSLRAFLELGGADPYIAYIGGFWFGIAELLLAGFAVHLVSGWAADDTEGILTAVLSTPRHRWSVVAERAAAAVVGMAIVVAAGSLVTALVAAAIGNGLETGALLRASWPLIPFGLTFAAVGAAASAVWPRAAIGVLGVLAFASYMLDEFAPILNWPRWVADLSVMQLYGNPYLSGVYWTGLWAMLAVAVAGFGLAAALMQRREVGV